jgi:hypothetical protein
MASGLGWLVLLATISVGGLRVGEGNTRVVFDKKGESEAKQATHLFRQGLYEEAATIYARLLVDYPNMVIFQRNLGACYYYLNRPEPALSNLRQYLSRRRDIAPDDRSVVDGWIQEMEKLRADNQSTPTEATSAKAEAGEPDTPIPEPVESAAPGGPTPALAAPTPAAAGPSVVPVGADLKVHSSPRPAHAPQRFYRKWWFWAGSGAVVVTAVITAILLSRNSRGVCDGRINACMGVE